MSTEKHEVHRDGRLLGLADLARLQDDARTGRLLPGDVIRAPGEEPTWAARDFPPLKDLFPVLPDEPESGEVALPSPEPKTPGRRPAIGFWFTGVFCILFAIADLILHSWDLHDLRAGSPAEDLGVLAPIIAGGFGVWLVSRTKRPRGPMTLPILVLATGICVALSYQGLESRLQVGDELIVQRGFYADICPGRTISELLDHGHDDVRWVSYFNIYGHRSVKASCIGSNPASSLLLIWTIDENDRFWIQYAATDGVPVEPYGMLSKLCQRLPSAASMPDGPR